MKHAWKLSLCAAAATLAALSMPAGPANAATAVAPRLLNDTGKIRCYQPRWGGVEIACAGTGQDGEYGRDVTDPRRFDGYAGFSYRKISASGETLPPTATEWACVEDRITGLMWEVKTADGGVRDWQRLYTHLDNGQSDDVSGFVRDVNQAGLCGHQDWRLPGRMELQSLVNYGHAGPMIISTWFPHTRGWSYWSSTQDVVDPFGPYWTVNFQYGGSGGSGSNENHNAARVVRGKPFPRAEHSPGRFVADGDKVTDTSTGLVWRRCSEGAIWTGSTCWGALVRVKWAEALDIAAAANYDGAAWRLPNATELFSLVDDRRYNPAMDVDAFPDMAGLFLPLFWSGTPGTPDKHIGLMNVRDVDFFSGSLATMDPENLRALRLVRVDAP